MAFFSNAFNTRQYEVVAIGDSSTPIAVGAAVKLITLPTGLTSPNFYFKVAVASSTDEIFGVVSAKSSPISDTVTGGVVLLNAGLIPILANAAGNKNDLIKVATTDGKWEVCTTGDLSEARLLETVTAGNLAWAVPVRLIA